jgi:hypothetical protein
MPLRDAVHVYLFLGRWWLLAARVLFYCIDSYRLLTWLQIKFVPRAWFYKEA